jgi:hypothetical protein
VTVATDLGVPRSTARGWLGAAPTVVVCLDVADLTEPELRQEVLKLRRRVQKLTALLRLALALLRTFGFGRAHPRETVSSQFARGNRVERLFENIDGRWTSGSGDGFTAGLRRRGAADSETTHGPWLPFHPLDECPRSLVFHDHDAQDAIFPQERSGANSGGLDGGIRSRRCGKIGRGASPHRRDESEHDVDGRASTVVPASGAGGTASGAPSTSRGCGTGGSS